MLKFMRNVLVWLIVLVVFGFIVNQTTYAQYMWIQYEDEATQEAQFVLAELNEAHYSWTITPEQESTRELYIMLLQIIFTLDNRASDG